MSDEEQEIKTTSDYVECMRELREKGYTFAAIAKMVDASTSYVYLTLKRAGLVVKRETYTEAIRKLADSGKLANMTLSEAAKEVGCHQTLVSVTAKYEELEVKKRDTPFNKRIEELWAKDKSLTPEKVVQILGCSLNYATQTINKLTRAERLKRMRTKKHTRVEA